MTVVTVFDFEVPDIHEGDFVLAMGKATREYVRENHGRVIEGTGEEVDSSQLHDGGRYTSLVQ